MSIRHFNDEEANITQLPYIVAIKYLDTICCGHYGIINDDGRKFNGKCGIVMNNPTIGIISGSTEILDFCKQNFKFHSWASVRHWRKKHSLPVRYWPNGIPYMIVSEVVRWGIELDRIKKEKKVTPL